MISTCPNTLYGTQPILLECSYRMPCIHWSFTFADRAPPDLNLVLLDQIDRWKRSQAVMTGNETKQKLSLVSLQVELSILEKSGENEKDRSLISQSEQAWSIAMMKTLTKDLEERIASRYNLMAGKIIESITPTF